MASDKTISDASARFGPWLSTKAIAGLPNLKRSFDLSRDPYIRAQLLDQPVHKDTTRSESGSRGSGMVRADKPAPTPKPPQEARRSADRQAFQSRWLTEQRDAVLARANAKQPEQTSSPAPMRQLKVPSR